MKYSNKRSPRLQGFDYSQEAYYFITTVTRDRKPFLGRISKGEMILSKAGQIVRQQYHESFQHKTQFSNEILCIMPNHVHFVIRLGEPELPKWVLPDEKTFLQQNFGGKVHALASFLRDFKRVSTIRIRESLNKKFGWNPGYHDHVVRDAVSLMRIKYYIKNNPRVKWERDGLKRVLSSTHRN